MLSDLAYVAAMAAADDAYDAAGAAYYAAKAKQYASL